MVLKNVFAALNENNFRSDTAEKLGEFAGDDSATEDDYTLRDEIEIEHVVACPERRSGESGDGGGRVDLGTGSDQKIFSRECASVGEGDGVRINEAGVTAVNIIFPTFESLGAVVGEFVDDLFLRA